MPNNANKALLTAKLRFLKMRKSTMGWSVQSSRTMNPMKRHGADDGKPAQPNGGKPVRVLPLVEDDLQGSKKQPHQAKADPVNPARPAGANVRRVFDHQQHQENREDAHGQIDEKVQRQENWSVSQPPRVGPTTGATTMPRPNKAVAVPRWVGGKLSSRMAWESGCMAPPPKPCKTRETTSIGMEVAIPQVSEATVNNTVQATRNRLRPKKLENQALAGRMTALATR